MRLVALTVLVVGNLFANQVHAGDVSPQPLTRVDCNKAEMPWDDNANVCGADWERVWDQPLTRYECDKAGTAWDDTANVCGTTAQVNAVPDASDVAESVIQPLTRQDCAKAAMAWNDSANVCREAPTVTKVPDAQGFSTVATSEVADTARQPLTRADCAKADMAWDDTANVCGAASIAAGKPPEGQEPVTEAASEGTSPIQTSVLINIDKASQTMTVLLDGVPQYEWPVSTGLRGYTTPSGTYTARSMNKIWYSRQWDNAPMPHALFFTRDGHAIHGTYEVKRLGKPASHGCVRLAPENAATLFALVEKTGLKNTQVVLDGSTPGGEGKVANSTRGKSSYRSRSRYESYYADSFPQRRRRGGIFRRLFGG
jgi:lipoprotein-anchoring transpeptidase ErfK/SrfK